VPRPQTKTNVLKVQISTLLNTIFLYHITDPILKYCPDDNNKLKNVSRKLKEILLYILTK